MRRGWPEQDTKRTRAYEAGTCMTETSHPSRFLAGDKIFLRFFDSSCHRLIYPNRADDIYILALSADELRCTAKW